MKWVLFLILLVSTEQAVALSDHSRFGYQKQENGQYCIFLRSSEGVKTPVNRYSITQSDLKAVGQKYYNHYPKNQKIRALRSISLISFLGFAITIFPISRSSVVQTSKIAKWFFAIMLGSMTLDKIFSSKYGPSVHWAVANVDRVVLSRKPHKLSTEATWAIFHLIEDLESENSIECKGF